MASGAIPQALYFLAGLIFLSFGSLLIGGSLAFRIRGIRTIGKIVAVKAVGGHDQNSHAPAADAGSKDDEPLSSYFVKHPGVFLFVAGFFLTFIVLPLGLVGAGSFIAFSHIAFIGKGIEATAHVEFIDHQIEKGQEVRYAVLIFGDTSGAKREVRTVIGIGEFPDVTAGSDISIYYLPDEKERVIADNILHYMKLPGILILSGLSIVMIVSLFSASSKKSEQAAFNGELYYPIFEYETLGGERIQSASYAGSATLGDKQPGSAVTLWVDPDDHTKVMRQQPLPYILGLIFGLPGLVFIYLALTQFPFSWLAPVVALGIVGFVAIEVFAVVRLQGGSGSLKESARKRHEEQLAQGRTLSLPELRARYNSRTKTIKLWLPLIVIIGVISVSGGVSLGRSLLVLEAEGFRADGVIVEVIRDYRTHDGIYVYYPVVSFRHEGQEFRFHDAAGSDVPTFHSGQKVDVLYHPNRPEKAIIDRGWLNWVAAAGFFLFGLLMLWLAYQSYLGMRSKL